MHQPVALVGIRMAELGGTVRRIDISGRTRGVVVEGDRGKVCQTKKRPRGGAAEGAAK